MGLLDRNWKYTPANETNIRKTFDRVRKEIAKAQKQRESDSRIIRLLPPANK